MTGGASAAIELGPAPALAAADSSSSIGCEGLPKQDSAASLKASERAGSFSSSVKDASEAEGEAEQLLAARGPGTASPFFWSLLR